MEYPLKEDIDLVIKGIKGGDLLEEVGFVIQ